MKGLCRRLCRVHPARVIHGSGQVLYLTPKTTVAQVLHSYPHHFLCQPGLTSFSGCRSNQMLALDTELQSGAIYFLFPLPRLFPSSPRTLSPSQSCSCFQSQQAHCSSSSSSSSSGLFYDTPRNHEGCSGRRALWCCSTTSKSQVAPESDLYSAGRRGDVVLMSSKPPWRPRLGCISEESDHLDVSLEDVNQFWGRLWKREGRIST